MYDPSLRRHVLVVRGEVVDHILHFHSDSSLSWIPVSILRVWFSVGALLAGCKYFPAKCWKRLGPRTPLQYSNRSFSMYRKAIPQVVRRVNFPCACSKLTW